MTGAEKGWAFSAGLDLSARRHHSALCIVGKHVGWIERRVTSGFHSESEELVKHDGTGRLRLAFVASWKPSSKTGKIDYESVQRVLLEAHKRFRLVSCLFDPFQGEMLSQLMRHHGIVMEAVAQTPSNLSALSACVLENFSSQTIELYDDADLLEDLGRLRIVETTFGKTRLASPRNDHGKSHGDRAVSLALAMLGATRYEATLPVFMPADWMPVLNPRDVGPGTGGEMVVLPCRCGHARSRHGFDRFGNPDGPCKDCDCRRWGGWAIPDEDDEESNMAALLRGCGPDEAT
jgi:hypothetical protein